MKYCTFHYDIHLLNCYCVLSSFTCTWYDTFLSWLMSILHGKRCIPIVKGRLNIYEMWRHCKILPCISGFVECSKTNRRVMCGVQGGYSTLSWVRMCGPKFRPPPYTEKTQICDLCLNHLFREGSFFETNQHIPVPTFPLSNPPWTLEPVTNPGPGTINLVHAWPGGGEVGTGMCGPDRVHFSPQVFRPLFILKQGFNI